MKREPQQQQGLWEKFRSHNLSVRNKVRLRLQARLPRVQLGHIENMLIFVLERPVGVLLREVAGLTLIRRK